MANEDADRAARSGGRSPGYPAIDLEEAVSRARAFWDAERKNAAPSTAATKHWGYSEKSSGGRQVLAALSYYGLLDDEGAGENRLVRLSQRALDIVLDTENSPRRLAALREAARQPRLFAELLARHDARELPSDASLAFYLQRDVGINPSAVQAFLKNFRATIKFARLDEPGAQSSGSAAPAAEETATQPTSSQPTHLGGQGFLTPGNATLSAHGVGVSAGSATLSGHAPVPFIGPSMRQEVFSLTEGAVVLQWPATMSQASYEDFKDWMALLVRKIGRSIQPKSDTLPSADE